jgi:hypothetical protein
MAWFTAAFYELFSQKATLDDRLLLRRNEPLFAMDVLPDGGTKHPA